MKRLYLSLLFSALFILSYSQKLNQVTLSVNGNLFSIGFLTDQGVIIIIDPFGNLVEWGTAFEQGRMNYYPGKLQPYMGRVEYYGAEADEALRGKAKTIGTCFISYYMSYENKLMVGKVKTVGTNALDYYGDFDNDALRGKLKNAGLNLLNYYGSFDNEVLKGKLKSLGNTALTYYSSFEDKLIKGKIKSIGTYNYSWYTSFDRKEFQGALKTGNHIQLVNGVNFIISLY